MGPPLVWVVNPSTDVHVGWLYSTCIIYWVGFGQPVCISRPRWFNCWGPPLGWVVIPSTAVHVGWLYSTCIIYWVGFAHPVPLSLSSWGRRNSTVCGHFLLYGVQDTQMHDLKMKQGLMFLLCFSYEY
jgi:hypothetical protein